MKKILWLLVILLLLFVGFTYISAYQEDYENTIIENIKNIENTNFSQYDSVSAAVTTRYEGNFIKRTMQGENYREAWSTPITVPVVFLDTLLGGMTIIKEGGGTQTQSLKVESSSGILYSLRGINKDPSSHVPEIAKTLGLSNIIIDGNSGQHPYGAVAAAGLAGEVDVLHTNPRPLFLPKQEKLGDLNEKYGNKLYLLEYETESEVNWTALQNIVEIIETDDLQELKAIRGDKLKIDRNALVRSRLFDLLIGDWDRHTKQWGWALQEQDSVYIAIPIAGDRDSAFFKLGGLIPSIISNKNIAPEVRPFKKKIDHLPGLVYPFDIYFLKNTPESVYVEEAKYIQTHLTNEKIDAALQKWPRVLYDLNGKEIAEKLKQRREDLVDYAISFQKIIEEREFLSSPLKGSEDLNLSPELLRCFECKIVSE